MVTKCVSMAWEIGTADGFCSSPPSRSPIPGEGNDRWNESLVLDTALLTYSMRSLAFKYLIWLVAAMTAAQPLTAATCCCAMASPCGDDAEKQQPTVAEKACCRQARSCCASNHVDTHSCCQGTVQGSARCCCQGTDRCCCGLDDSSIPKQLAPAEGSSRAADELAQPPTTVSRSLREFQVTPRIFGADRSATTYGLECCIILCRFNL